MCLESLLTSVPPIVRWVVFYGGVIFVVGCVVLVCKALFGVRLVSLSFPRLKALAQRKRVRKKEREAASRLRSRVAMGMESNAVDLPEEEGVFSLASIKVSERFTTDLRRRELYSSNNSDGAAGRLIAAWITKPFASNRRFLSKDDKLFYPLREERCAWTLNNL